MASSTNRKAATIVVALLVLVAALAGCSAARRTTELTIGRGGDPKFVDDSGVTIGAYSFDAYQKAYGPSVPGTTLESTLTPAGAAATPLMAKLCLLGQNKALHKIAGPLVGHYLAGDPAKVEPWKTWLAENTPGNAPIGVPILVVQGESDTIVHPPIARQFRDTLAGKKVAGTCNL